MQETACSLLFVGGSVKWTRRATLYKRGNINKTTPYNNDNCNSLFQLQLRTLFIIIIIISPTGASEARSIPQFDYTIFHPNERLLAIPMVSQLLSRLRFSCGRESFSHAQPSASQSLLRSQAGTDHEDDTANQF